MIEYVNNHIHTKYSFSPYSPEEAVYAARAAGLKTAGLMDHDTVAGADEFIAAGKAAGIATTVGIECRCSMAGTPFEGKKMNNPDQESVSYLAMHGIPHGALDRVTRFITPYRDARNLRNRKMTQKLDEVFTPHGLSLDFDTDVVPISMSERGGTITERHILFALANKLITRFGAGGGVLRFLSGAFGIEAAGGARDKLLSPGTPFYEYYLLGLLKGSFVERFYIDAADELPRVADFLSLSEAAGAISAYAYLGDIKNSVTGDKKDSLFEDAYLDELVEWLASAGFRALTYMPTRNTREQADRVMALCKRHGLFQISGEDINSPFQSFICKAYEEPRFMHLVTATWALIGHEKAATGDPARGMFSPDSIAQTKDLDERIEKFAAIGRQG